MSRTKKDRPWRIRDAEGMHVRVCPGCPWCGRGEEAKTEARVKRRQDDRRTIEEQTELVERYRQPERSQREPEQEEGWKQ